MYYFCCHVGVTAYNGAAPLISDTTLLANAVGIGLVEAYHAGIVSTIMPLLQPAVHAPAMLGIALGSCMNAC